MKQSNETAKLEALIDENLRKAYQDALDQQVPDRFKELLDQLRKKEAKR